MIRDMLRKVITQEGEYTKQRLQQSGDLKIIIDGMNELELREYASKEIGDGLAWSVDIDKLTRWYVEK